MITGLLIIILGLLQDNSLRICPACRRFEEIHDVELGIPGGRRQTVDTNGEKFIDSDHDIGETVISMVLRHSNKRKRRQVSSYIGDDVLLINESAPQHEIFLKSCPATGQKETLYLAINDARDKGHCPNSSITISVQASVKTPRFVENSSEFVSVDHCAVTIAIVNVSSLILNSADACEKQWKCTVNCTNNEKLFWIGTDMVLRTYTNNIDYAKIYDVEITCVETGTDPMYITSANMKSIEISFREHLLSCPITMSTMGLQNPNLSLLLTTPNDYEENVNSFFEDTKNIAALSSVGGVAAGGAIGAGVYIMTKKQCSTKKEATRETGDVNGGDPE